MNYKQRIKNFLINKKEKKKFDDMIKDKKSNLDQNDNQERKDDNYYQDLEYLKEDPSLKKFFDRYSYINKKRFQNRANLKKNENREEIFLEINERINFIKDQKSG